MSKWVDWVPLWQSLCLVCFCATCSSCKHSCMVGAQFAFRHIHTLIHAKSLQLCPTLCNPMDWSSPGSSVHGILQARILEWVAIAFSRRSSWPSDQTQVSHIADRFFTIWATREALCSIRICQICHIFYYRLQPLQHKSWWLVEWWGSPEKTTEKVIQLVMYRVEYREVAAHWN